MKLVPHPHHCLCARAWQCMNALCRAGELTPCRTPKCSQVAKLRQLAWLEDQMDVTGHYEQTLREYGEEALATAMHGVRTKVLLRVEQESRRLLNGH